MEIRLKYNNQYYKILNDYTITNSTNTVAYSDISIQYNSTDTKFRLPLKYEQVQIIQANSKNELYNGEVIFTGYVNGFKISSMKNKIEEREITFELLSPFAMSTLRSVTLMGTYTTEEAIENVLQPLVDDGFTINTLNVDSGQITTNYVIETVNYCMADICRKKNLFWYINEKQEIFVYTIADLFKKNPIANFTDEQLEYIKENYGLYDIEPTIQETDYANALNIKNVRIMYAGIRQYGNEGTYQGNIDIFDYAENNSFKKGDEVDFKYPVALKMNKEWSPNVYTIDEDGNSIPLWFTINSKASNKSTEIMVKIDKNTGNYILTDNASFDYENKSTDFVFKTDSFFKNVVTGFKYNGDETLSVYEYLFESALVDKNVKFYDTTEIYNMRNKVSKSGIIEKNIDYNNKWTYEDQIMEFAKNQIIESQNSTNEATLKFDKKINFKIGDIITLNMSNFYCSGQYAIVKVDYTYVNDEDENTEIQVKKASLLDDYISLFRNNSTQEDEEKTADTLIINYNKDTIHEAVSFEESEI